MCVFVLYFSLVKKLLTLSEGFIKKKKAVHQFCFFDNNILEPYHHNIGCVRRSDSGGIIVFFIQRFSTKGA